MTLKRKDWVGQNLVLRYRDLFHKVMDENIAAKLSGKHTCFQTPLPRFNSRHSQIFSEEKHLPGLVDSNLLTE